MGIVMFVLSGFDGHFDGYFVWFGWANLWMACVAWMNQLTAVLCDVDGSANVCCEVTWMSLLIVILCGVDEHIDGYFDWFGRAN